MLTPKQQRFVDEYLIDLNATQAAIRAGYSEKGAHVRGAELLRNRKVAAAIQAAREELAKATGITQERVLRELAAIGFSDLRKVFTPGGNLLPVHDLDNEIAPAIASVEVVGKPGAMDADGNREVEYVHKIKVWDKNSALEKLGKHLGMFVDRKEVTGKNGGPVEFVMNMADD